MITQKRGCYTVKTYYNELYTWCPDTGDKKGKRIDGGTKTYCTATPGSQGEDWNCTYVYNLAVLDGIQKRIAYVACDYVK